MHCRSKTWLPDCMGSIFHAHGDLHFLGNSWAHGMSGSRVDTVGEESTMVSFRVRKVTLRGHTWS
jgi:hypothetical protein